MAREVNIIIIIITVVCSMEGWLGYFMLALWTQLSVGRLQKFYPIQACAVHGGGD